MFIAVSLVEFVDLDTNQLCFETSPDDRFEDIAGLVFAGDINKHEALR